MVFPTSTTPSGPESFSGASTSANFDSVDSLKLLLDIISPPDFATLLRVRVSHLLRIWPPSPASTSPTTPSSSSTRSNEYAPSFETVRAFAAFFRRPNPGFYPLDLATTTSLETLHHYLLALKTLLSILSARELQGVVRSRLTDNGRERYSAVHALMEVLRDPRGGDSTLEQLVAGRLATRSDGLDNDGGELENNEQPLMQAEQVTSSGSGKRKELATSCEVTESAEEGEVPPPRKRRRGDDDTPEDLQLPSPPPVDAPFVLIDSPHPALPPCEVSASAFTAPAPSVLSMEKTDSGGAECNPTSEEHSPSPTEMDNPPASKSIATSEPLKDCGSRPETPEVKNLAEVSAETSEGDSRTSTKIVQNSDEEDEGLVVTLIEEDTAHHGLQTASTPPESSFPAAQMEPVSSNPLPAPVVVPPLSTSLPRFEEKPMPKATFEADLDSGPGPGVSRAEWNRKRFRAALGLPPKEPEKPVEDNRETETKINVVSASGTQEEKYHNVDNTSPALVLKANEGVSSSDTILNPAGSCSHDASFVVMHAHTAGSPPHHGYPVSRSPTPSLHDSDVDDPGSPPGPLLRAVDWTSHDFPESVTSDMEVDELDEEADSLALCRGGPYNNLGLNIGGGVKPSTAFSKGFAYQHTPMGGWHNPDVVGPIWDDEEEEKPFTTGSEIDQNADPTQSQTASGTESRRKLFIRLPARGAKGGDAAMVSAGTDVSASASVSASPTPPTPYPIPRSSEKGGVNYNQATERGTSSLVRSLSLSSTTAPIGKDDEEALNMQRPKMPSPMGSGPTSGVPSAATSGSATDTSRPSSHSVSHVPSTTHTPPNAIPGGVPHGLHPPQYGPHGPLGPHSQPYPPPHPHPHAHHGYPGPWFGAMFYVPYGGGPHVRTPHPHGHPHHPQQPPPHPAHHHHHHHPHHPPPPGPAPSSSHMLSSGISPSQSSPSHAQPSPAPGPSKPTVDIPRSPHVAASESAAPPPPPPPPASGPSTDPVPAAASSSAPEGGPPVASGSQDAAATVAPPEAPKRYLKRRPPGGDIDSPPPGGLPDDDPDVRYTDDVGVKESAILKRLCFNCRAAQAPSWRKSKLNVGKILCNKCGIYESTHMTPRPLKTRPRRANNEGAPPTKKRKYSKKPPPPPIPHIPIPPSMSNHSHP